MFKMSSFLLIHKPWGAGAIGQQHCRWSSDPEPPTCQTSLHSSLFKASEKSCWL